MSKEYQECKQAIEKLNIKENVLKAQLREIQDIKKECIKILVDSLISRKAGFYYGENRNIRRRK